MKRIFLDKVATTGSISNGSAVTLGVFDGMHQGHLRVLGLTSATGKRLGASTVVVTFSIHPENILNGSTPKMILSLEHRLRLIERAGIDKTVIIPFNTATRTISADSFLKDFLLGNLGMKAMILGHDTAFGSKREGDVHFLEKHKEACGFEVLTTEQVKVRETVISSTRIREAIRTGNLQEVEEMLGRELSLYGKVVTGDQRGREIGFPTANLDCELAVLPPAGVYAVRVLHMGIMRRAVMNIGTRPTFYQGSEKLLTTVEVHIPNFSGDLYGETLEVFLIRKIRDEKRFESLAALIKAIEEDIASLERRQ